MQFSVEKKIDSGWATRFLNRYFKIYFYEVNVYFQYKTYYINIYLYIYQLFPIHQSIQHKKTRKSFVWCVFLRFKRLSLIKTIYI